MNAMTRRHLIMGGLGLFGAGTLVACSPQNQSAGSDTSASTVISHIHAIARDPADTAVVLLAAHEGLFQLRDQELIARGPAIDLMGFTVTPEGRYFASGHPGPGTDLPEPLGLMESIDRGESWEVLSRGGESDFHALAANSGQILGFDGELRLSTNGRTWESLTLPSAPAAVAIAEGSGIMLASTEKGVLRSGDGSTWETLETPQLVQVLTWADSETIVGASVEGYLLISRNSGDTWAVGAARIEEISAVEANLTVDGRVEVLLGAGSSVLRTFDLGETTDRLL